MNVSGTDVSNDLPLNWIRTTPEHGDTILLLHPVGLDLTYWDRQIDALQPAYSVVAFDLPGHGRSGGGPQDWSFEEAVATVMRLISMASTGPVHLVGLSFGGMIAQATVLAHPEMVRSLTLMATACTFAEPVRAAMRSRAQTSRTGGMAAVLPSSLERWFTPETLTRRPDLIAVSPKPFLPMTPRSTPQFGK